MMVRIGGPAPDFTADATEGRSMSTSGIGDKWAILFRPEDFTPICTTGLGYREAQRIRQRNTKVLGREHRSPVADHHLWVRHRGYSGHEGQLPFIRRHRSRVRESLWDAASDVPATLLRGRTGPPTTDGRTVFVIGPTRM